MFTLTASPSYHPVSRAHSPDTRNFLDQKLAEFNIVKQTAPVVRDIPMTSITSAQARARASTPTNLDWDSIFKNATHQDGPIGFPFDNAPEAFKSVWNELTKGFDETEKRMASMPFLEIYVSQERFGLGRFRTNEMDDYVYTARFQNDIMDLRKGGDIFYPDEYVAFSKEFLSKMVASFADYEIKTPDEASQVSIDMRGAKEATPPMPSSRMSSFSPSALSKANKSGPPITETEISDTAVNAFKEAAQSYRLGAKRIFGQRYYEPIRVPMLV